MNTLPLLEQLLDIERSIGIETNDALRRKVQDAEDCLVQLQKEIAENLHKESGRSTPRHSEFAALP
jgi:hypothetical protein